MSEHDGEGNRTKIMDFIIEFKRANGGNDPSVRRIEAETGVAFSTVNYHISVLVQSGRLVRNADDRDLFVGWSVPGYEYVREGAEFFGLEELINDEQ